MKGRRGRFRLGRPTIGPARCTRAPASPRSPGARAIPKAICAPARRSPASPQDPRRHPRPPRSQARTHRPPRHPPRLGRALGRFRLLPSRVPAAVTPSTCHCADEIDRGHDTHHSSATAHQDPHRAVLGNLPCSSLFPLRNRPTRTGAKAPPRQRAKSGTIAADCRGLTV